MLSSSHIQRKKPIPEKYLCSITGQIMAEPVFTADGHTYEKEAIAEWLKKHNTSPKTNLYLANKHLTANHGKRGDILGYLDKNPELSISEEWYLPQSWIASLVVGIKQGQLSEIEAWLKKDQRLLNIKIENNYAAWHLACQYGSIEIVRLLLNILTPKQLIAISQNNPSDFKPIYINALLEQCLTQKDTKQASLLLKLGAELEQPELSTNNTLLQRFVVQGDKQSVAWLLDQHANLESCNKDGNTPLLLAILYGHFNIAEFLIKLGSNTKHKNHEQNNPVALTILNNAQEILKLLIEEKLTALPPLHLALKLNDVTLLKSLLTKKLCNVDAVDLQTGNTALHLAAKLGQNEVIPLLLKAEANHKARNNQWQTPVKLAIQSNKIDTAKLILQTMRDIKLARMVEVDTMRHKITKLEQEKIITEQSQLLRIAQLEDTIIKEIKAREELQVKLEIELEEKIKSRTELCSAYQLIKMDTEKLKDIVHANETTKYKAITDKEELSKFLRLVVGGEQNQAEAMLKNTPELALFPANVTDLSGRTFKNITGFQYAVWALDSHMWTMLQKYLTSYAAIEQIKGLEVGPWVYQHGKSASWQNLINALDEFIKLQRQSRSTEADSQWCTKVSNAQKLLPTHVVNQYCHPDRSFELCPNFKNSAQLPRSRKTDMGDWFQAIRGRRIGFCRGNMTQPKWAEGCWEANWQGPLQTLDCEALREYLNTQKQLRDQLFVDIAQTVRLSKFTF